MKKKFGMEEICKLDISEMIGRIFYCSCGRAHVARINRIYIGEDLRSELSGILKKFSRNSLFFITDSNAFLACGNEVLEFLREEKFKVQPYIFNSPLPLIPDERALGRLLLEIRMDLSIIIACGSGTLNDLSRYLSYILNVPYIIICTAPSMDGYASSVSPLIVEGFKKTFEAREPYAILCNEKVIVESPMDMIRAGFGDMIGKFTALSDWLLSSKINDEYYCESCASLIKSAALKTAEDAVKIGGRNEKSVIDLLRSLILSGITMSFIGNSRPASGAEHHLAHYWEMKAISQGKEHPLHGNMVGIASVIISEIYEYQKDVLEREILPPGPGHLRNMLEKTGTACDPESLGVDKELFRESIVNAMKLRPRYTILRYLESKNLLHDTAEIITGRYYG